MVFFFGMGLKLLLLLLQLSVLKQAQASNNTSTINASDMYALRHLRYSLQVRNFYWPKSSQDPCSTWRGVDCEQGRVVGIHLSGLKRTLSGMSMPKFAVDSLRQLSSLRYLNASGFELRGSIPYWFGELSELKALDLSSCLGVEGPVPDSIGQLRSLEFLSLARNSLSGSLPYSIGNLASLSSLNLSSNKLSGWLPSSLETLASLVTLDLSNNMVEGIPTFTTGVSTTIQHLDLSRNRFNTSLEQLGVQTLGNITSLRLSGNSFSGEIPQNLSRCTMLQLLDLSHNSLTGRLPAELGSLRRLRFLDLSHNHLLGFLPAQLGSLENIQRVDLSDNQFYGELPAGFINLKNLIFFDISADFFNGTVPDEIENVAVLSGNCLENAARQRFMRDCQAFYASQGLEFTGEVGMLPTATPVIGINGRYGGFGKSKQHVGAIIGGILGCLGFILVVILVVYAFQQHERKSRRTDKVSSSQTEASLRQREQPITNVTVNLSCIGEAFTYAQLQRATHDFNPVNLIRAGHTGDLFRGVLDGGLLVVIKRVDVTTLKRDSLLSELELFSKASHTRLVPLLGHCLEREREKFLVYKYMQYGDLAQALHRKIIPSPPKDILQSLDWITRLKIAIGAAEGLAYLHHECSPALVHRDIKATSILLDDKFEVRLGSLSEARIQDGGLHPNLIMRFLRRSQTSEQDPDSPVASCSYDVYCFGKVLLELVSGKLGLSGTMDPGADTYVETILPLIDRHEKENLSKIVDPSLLVDDDLLEEVWAVAIVAKMCLNPKPSRRPAIRQILKALENPQRVVRDENFTASLRRSSHSSWNGSLFGSWRHSSSETVIPAPLKEEEHLQEGTSNNNNKKHSSNSSMQDHGNNGSHRRHGSSEIFPEPFEGQQIQHHK